MKLQTTDCPYSCKRAALYWRKAREYCLCSSKLKKGEQENPTVSWDSEWSIPVPSTTELLAKEFPLSFQEGLGLQYQPYSTRMIQKKSQTLQFHFHKVIASTGIISSSFISSFCFWFIFLQICAGLCFPSNRYRYIYNLYPKTHRGDFSVSPLLPQRWTEKADLNQI